MEPITFIGVTGLIVFAAVFMAEMAIYICDNWPR